MRITRTLKIAVVAAFSVAIATFATQPAQAAKFTLFGGYKYAGIVGGTEEHGCLHGANLHFLWSLGERHDEERPRHVFGFGVGGGAAIGRQAFFDLSLNYEYVFSHGLGISVGLGTTGVTAVGDSDSDGDGVEGNEADSDGDGNEADGDRAGSVGAGGGVSDLGLRYHFRNGLVLSTTVDLQSSPVASADMLYAINVGLGYEF